MMQKDMQKRTLKNITEREVTRGKKEETLKRSKDGKKVRERCGTRCICKEHKVREAKESKKKKTQQKEIVNEEQG